MGLGTAAHILTWLCLGVFGRLSYLDRMQRKEDMRMTRYLLVHVSSSTDVKDNLKTIPGCGMDSCISSDSAM